MQPAMTATARRMFVAIAASAIFGVVVSSLALYRHYGTSQSSFCDFGGKFNCDIVNHSIYAEIFGIPVALIGVLGYLGVLGFTTFCRRRPHTPKILLIASTAGLAFALYLTYIEGFVLAAWCVLCLSSLAAIFFITVLSALLVARSRRGNGLDC
jgi:vitamin-K-epoxide reductase (warfarin-sensitive)